MCHHHETSSSNERKTLIVIIFTILAMFAEIIYGYLTNSMALLADGYHMATHALALSLTYVAYILIRKFKDSDLFPTGTDKIGTLAAYTSSLFLGLTGFWIIVEAIQRIMNPLQIQFNEAILVAIIGLLVNGVCIFIMEGKHEHNHNHKKDINIDNDYCCSNEEHFNTHNEDAHTHHEHHNNEKEDYNFKAAYFHILADVLTSILAIIALFAGKYLNLFFLDALIGILGGVMILKWAANLLKNTVKELINMKKIQS